MSGIINRVRVDELTDTRIAWNVYLGHPLPAGEFINGTVSLYPGGPPTDIPNINPGPLPGNQLVFFIEGASGGIQPNTTYWLRVWHEDADGNVLGEAGRWVSTFPAGSVDEVAPGEEFIACGETVSAGEDRVAWGYGPNHRYGGNFRSATIARDYPSLGQEVA